MVTATAFLGFPVAPFPPDHEHFVLLRLVELTHLCFISQVGTKDVTIALDPAALRGMVAQFQGVREQLAAIAGEPAGA